MDPSTIDPPKASTCTSCKMVEDFSNYWTASIYFRSPDNGTFTRVPQMANGRLNGTMLEQEGGITVYYMRPFSGRDMKMKAMQPVSIYVESICTASRPRLTYEGFPYACRRSFDSH